MKGYLLANTVQQNVLKYHEDLSRDNMVGLRNYAYLVSDLKGNKKKIEMLLQFNPG